MNLQGSSVGPINTEKIDEDHYKVIIYLHVGLDNLELNKKVSIIVNIKTSEIEIE